VLALDVGGANIKAADGLGWSHSEAFALWRHAAALPDALGRILRLPRPRRTGARPRVVATMTGEIADCFATRSDGVAHIVGSLVSAVRSCDPEVRPEIYLVDGRLAPAEEALRRPLSAAASNWHAVARLAAAHAGAERSLLVDIGSTTTDIVPLRDGVPAPLATDDAGRMASGELVYTGVERTPVAAIVRSLPWRGSRRPVAAECFAESRDVWLLLGGLAEDPDARETADGGPSTRAAARVRLARMLLAEPGDVTTEEAVAAAEWCAEAQGRLVAGAIARVAGRIGWRPTSVVLSGHGDCLARRACDRFGWTAARVSLPERLGRDISRVAPAHALALIARGVLP
jgi:probable H4MPT-linked C1 transfer pathway protein